MNGIVRDPQAAAARHYDIIIIGGGIYGATLLYEATRHGLSAILVEKDDFGGATSLNNFRILHGGLRYLQKLDLPRFFESVAERRWFLRNFPGLTAPIGCLMPLYGRGAKRPGVFRLALAVNALLSAGRNKGVPASNHLPYGNVMTPHEVADAFPMVRQKGLRGGAIWFDGLMPDPQRILITLLRAACSQSAVALNYTDAKERVMTDGRVTGIRIIDRLSGAGHTLSATYVINATGPWSRQTAAALGDDRSDLFVPTLAWNVLFNRPAISEYAVAIEPEDGGQILFVLPWKGRVLAGTGHAPWTGAAEEPHPSPQQLATFLDQLNRAAPSLRFSEDQIERVYAGLLPGVRQGHADLSDRPRIVDHGAHGGPNGLFSVIGVKYTTARAVAERMIRMLPYGRRPVKDIPLTEHIIPVDPTSADSLRRLCEEESVQHLDDLLLRRGVFTPGKMDLSRAIEGMASVRKWSQDRIRQETLCLWEKLERAGFTSIAKHQLLTSTHSKERSYLSGTKTIY